MAPEVLVPPNIMTCPRPLSAVPAAAARGDTRSPIDLNARSQGTYRSAADNAAPADVPPTIRTLLLSGSRKAW